MLLPTSDGNQRQNEKENLLESKHFEIEQGVCVCVG